MPENTQPALLDYLTRRYGELKLRLARVLRNADLAGDALQDTWLRLHSQPEEGLVVRSPRAYLIRMAANAAVDIRRRHGQSLAHEEISELLDLADPAPGPAQVAGARSDLGQLVRLLERLPARQREVIVLVRWEGMAQKEVARRLGVSLRTVELDLKRAHDYLDARMADEKK
ncbi:RNA polymerase sigma factor [Janthinobacterium fluminis]|uniref:RNA polymerase sigma factor n=1 Tax=Janthinobacterium fluminis TaxID=2987524 RepID=A0ABT5K3U2_9BURK|nr:RNA polymerase sigma factor [Janthinobacterium fluminis]MDC8759661.1 RNA polymerase sigma factor [Janthinobacterium fluminis]